MKRFLLSLLILLCAIPFVACNSEAKKIGICLPTNDDAYFGTEGEYYLTEFKAKGHEVLIKYCENNAQKQEEELRSLISEKCDIIIVAPIDTDDLKTAVADAKSAGIKIIAYQTAIDGADANITFDTSKTGLIIGEYLENKLGLKDTTSKLEIEMFCGSLSNELEKTYYNDSMSVLEPYFASKTLSIGSGLKDYDKVASDGTSDEAETRLIKLLARYYIGTRNLHAIYTSDETIANGVRSALTSSGHYEKSYPVVTTVGCSLSTAKRIKEGTQTMAVFSDRSKLLYSTVDVTLDYLSGKSSLVSKTFEPVVITKENYKTELIDTGVYTEEQLK